MKKIKNFYSNAYCPGAPKPDATLSITNTQSPLDGGVYVVDPGADAPIDVATPFDGLYHQAFTVVAPASFAVFTVTAALD
jgi:hypothetical protein